MMNIHQILKDNWGYDAFRPLQEDIINSVLQGYDTLALMPTGGGKSICFQLPALLFDGTSDEIMFAILKATLAVLAITSGIQGWLLSWLSLGERLVLILSGIAVFNELLTINLVGFILISAIFFFRYFYPEVKIIK